MFCPDCGSWNSTRAATCARCQAELPALPDAPLDKPDEEISQLRIATGNRYRVVKRLGSGGMAHVYFAEHATLGRALVIKVLHRHLARDEEMRERFFREAEAASRLVHPHILTIEDYGEAPDDIVYLVMPYCAGGSLAGKLMAQRTLDPAYVAATSAQLASALDYAHRLGLVHRDIKPDNVLFDADGHVRLTDFGIATARSHTRLTATGRAMGTPHYMSPEQAMGKLIDGRSDLYGIGVLLYECILGFPPFDGADAYSIGFKHVNEAPVAPDTVDSRIPAALSAIIMRCLAKNPAERYERGDHLSDALMSWLATTNASTSTTEPERRARVSRAMTPFGGQP
jgi:serine/threonine-protein kinase